MTDTILATESSVELSKPREFYELTQSGTIIYRVASGVRDVVYNGNTFPAYPAARTDFKLSTTTGEIALTLALPLSHPLAQRWPAQASPPNRVSVIVRRLQYDTGDVEQVYGGQLDSMGFDRHVAKFKIVSNASRQWARPAGALANVLCARFLYDAGCKVVRSTFSVNTTISVIDGRTIYVASLAPLLPFSNDTQYFLSGSLFHPTSGERQTILAHTGTKLTLKAPIPGIQTGDNVTIAAGCAHDVQTCRNKFNNQKNFFGQPYAPTQDVFLLGNRLGIFH